MFDFGDDKKIDKSTLRGFRWLYHHPRILREQLAAILKVNTSNFKILIPMVETVKDYYFVKDIVDEMCMKYNCAKPEVGVMIENYSALCAIDTFLSDVDFINIGTNDLIADCFHTTRENPIYDKKRFLIIVQDIIAHCKRFNVPVCVCGESVKEFGDEFLRMGATSISTNISDYKGVVEKCLKIL